ncbi:MAG: hypothetical protein U0175_31055 [Caldilineaceae bacterium]
MHLSPPTDLRVYHGSIEAALEKLRSQRVIERIWQRDETLWQHSTTKPAFGWLTIMDETLAEIERIKKLVIEIREAGLTQAVLLGMGGASTTSVVLRTIFGVKVDYLDLTILNTTVPSAVLSVAEQLEPQRTLFILCTKSGQTVETMALLQYFYQWMVGSVGEDQAGSHFIAITDRDTESESFARSHGFRSILIDNPEVVGVFSALSYFGMVPAALAGIDVIKLLQSGSRAAAEARRLGVDDQSAWLGAVLGALALAGRDKLTFIASAALGDLGIWLEQLIATSTGKNGVGIVPVEGEALLKPRYYRQDRIFVYLRMVGDSALDTAVEQLREAGQTVLQFDITFLNDLGAEFFRWQMAASVASYLLGVNPCEFPKLYATKAAVLALTGSGQTTSEAIDPQPLAESDGMTLLTTPNPSAAAEEKSDFEETIGAFLNAAVAQSSSQTGNSYFALLAFLAPTPEIDDELHRLRTQIQRRTQLATNIDYGPHLLHSTAGLHLEDSGKGYFIQFTANSLVDAPIPDALDPAHSSLSFDQLTQIEALVNWRLLVNHQRNVIRIHLGDDPVASLAALTSLLHE